MGDYHCGNQKADKGRNALKVNERLRIGFLLGFACACGGLFIGAAFFVTFPQSREVEDIFIVVFVVPVAMAV